MKKIFIFIFVMLIIQNSGFTNNIEELYKKSKSTVNLNEKANILEQILELDKNNTKILQDLGIVYYQLKDYEKSDYYLNKAIQITNKDVEHETTNKTNHKVLYSETQQYDLQTDFLNVVNDKIKNIYEDNYYKLLNYIPQKMVIHNLEQTNDFYNNSVKHSNVNNIIEQIKNKQTDFVEIKLNNNQNKSNSGFYNQTTKDLININTADKNILMNKLGLTNIEAIMIIKYRERYGDFITKEQFKNIPGLSNKYNQIKNLITVE